MSKDGPRVGYRVCPDCCYTLDGFGPTGFPQYNRNPSGEGNAIRKYRDDHYFDGEWQEF